MERSGERSDLHVGKNQIQQQKNHATQGGVLSSFHKEGSPRHSFCLTVTISYLTVVLFSGRTKENQSWFDHPLEDDMGSQNDSDNDNGNDRDTTPTLAETAVDIDTYIPSFGGGSSGGSEGSDDDSSSESNE